MNVYIHNLKDWPEFLWDSAALAQKLASVRNRQGQLIGKMKNLGFGLRQEAELETLTEEIEKSSDIEGETLDRESVRSSVARRLGMDIGASSMPDSNVDGVVDMMLDATREFNSPLTAERLFGWHTALFPTGFSGLNRIKVGCWRDDCDSPMRVVSGMGSRERIHFEAPAAARLDSEMELFLAWFNSDVNIDPVLKAGLAHLWFVTIHPFEDGNGRIARAIADMALARSDGTPQRFYSMSAQIRIERKGYYNILETTQKGSLDITLWMGWFLDCLARSFDGAEGVLETVLKKAHFWMTHANESFNERQRLLLNKLLNGFTGKLTTKKWVKIARCSSVTAYRDILDLLERGILLKESAGGRSTSYTLNTRAQM